MTLPPNREIPLVAQLLCRDGAAKDSSIRCFNGTASGRDMTPHTTHESNAVSDTCMLSKWNFDRLEHRKLKVREKTFRLPSTRRSIALLVAVGRSYVEMAPVRRDKHPVVRVQLAGVGSAHRGCAGRGAHAGVTFSEVLQRIRDHFGTSRKGGNHLRVGCRFETSLKKMVCCQPSRRE